MFSTTPYYSPAAIRNVTAEVDSESTEKDDDYLGS